MNKDSVIYVAGHNGMVGSAVVRALQNRGYIRIVGKSSKNLDLKDQLSVRKFFEKETPHVVINAAARVGGILANNNYPYQFLMENMQIQNNLIDASLKHRVDKFIFLGSSCIYPKLALQPLKEEYLLTAALEPTNEYYAIAKIAGLKLCAAIRKQFKKDFISLMPTNLYGPNDNFDLTTSHVLPSMIRKFHEAKLDGNADVTLWGSGEPLREFLHVDDLANAVVFVLENKLKEDFFNVGTGKDMSVKSLATLIQNIVEHKGEIKWDISKPDGTPRKLLDISRMTSAGWRARIDLKEGITSTYKWFLEHRDSLKEVKI